MFAVPFVENVHRRVYEVIIENPKSFNMGVWHGQNSCGTTHCRAGWVIELAGEQGYALQKQTSPTFAALQIYKASCPELPVSPYRFHESNELALANIKEYAEKEQQLKMTASPNLTPQPTLQTLINGWKLNKELLSSRMKMPVGTFKHKFNETNGKYRFTDNEREQLLAVLRELSTDIELVAGLTFNSALAGKPV
jgi:hypothetical protein